MNPKQDEFWIARIVPWTGAEPIVTVVQIYYVWSNGDIQFLTFDGPNEPLFTARFESVEFLERIEVEKYK